MRVLRVVKGYSVLGGRKMSTSVQIDKAGFTTWVKWAMGLPTLFSTVKLHSNEFTNNWLHKRSYTRNKNTQLTFDYLIIFLTACLQYELTNASILHQIIRITSSSNVILLDERSSKLYGDSSGAILGFV